MNGLALQLADGIACGCGALAEAALKRLAPARRIRVRLLPLGVNTARFSMRAHSALVAAPHFVNVGSLLPVKDHVLLLHAFARVRSELTGARLTIAGSGPLAGTLRTIASRLALDECVTFAGELAHDQLPALYSGAAVFVQSSRHEGQGMALLEAAACGCAVCGTNVGALRDLADREGAIPAPVADAGLLAAAMRDTFARRSVLAERAGQIVRNEYNLEQTAARLLDLDSQLVSSQTYRGTRLVNP
jgi:phenylacetate-CoA ligase